MKKMYSLWGRVGKGFDWTLLRSNVKRSELPELIKQKKKTYREVDYREQ